MLQTVLNYQHYLSNISEYISQSHYKSTYFIDKLKCNKQTFYRKLRENKFSVNEVLELTKILFPEEFYKYELLKELKEADDDFENGRIRNHKNVMEELKKEFIA